MGLRDQALADRVQDEFRHAPEVQLLHDVRPVSLDGAQADALPGGDLAVGVAESEQPKDALLLRRQPGGGAQEGEPQVCHSLRDRQGDFTKKRAIGGELRFLGGLGERYQLLAWKCTPAGLLHIPKEARGPH